MGMEVAEQKLHVLAVDDSLLDRMLIERLLRTSSYQVTTVNSGIEALEFLGFQEDRQDVKVNLIITDYCMPRMTGYDLLKKVKESSSLRNIPVVIMSSENVSSRINSCLEEGAEEFFLKPVKLSDVKKLRPHMLEGKCGGQKQREKQEDYVDNRLQEVEQQRTEAQQQQKLPHKQQLNSKKRKSLDEGITADKTRPRCSGLKVA